MTRVFLFLFFLLTFKCVNAQEPVADTIKYIITVEPKDALFYQRQAKRTKNPTTSLELLKKALSLRTLAQDENWVADVRVEMASSLFKTGNSKQAFSELLTAEKIYTASGNNVSKAEVMVQMARFYEKNALWKDAVKYYQAAHKLHETAQNNSDAANISLHLADIALIQNELTKATNDVSYAVKQYESLENKTGLALSYVKQAEIHRRRKQYKTGESLILNSALPFFRSTGYAAGRVGCFDVLGKIYFSQKRYSEAKWFFIQANTQARSLNDIEGIITSLINLGRVKTTIGDYNLAKRDFKEAQTLADRRNNLFLQANVKDAYAFLYDRMGNELGAENAAGLSAELTDSLNKYSNAQAESARTASVKLSESKKESKSATASSKADSFQIIKLIAAAILILVVILLVLKRIK
ncbi:MAG: hypothetical protein H7Y13_00570 [Sphingobacteriaceae bacterium]|nr:hypothetical protein [Sphingobacteriaceae bacterium]